MDQNLDINLNRSLLCLTCGSPIVSTDVSPHLIFKNGPHPTLWPQDLPYPEDGEPKNEQNNGYPDDASPGKILIVIRFVSVYIMNTNFACPSLIQARCSIWSRARRGCCPTRCTMDAPLICHYMSAVRFVRRNSNRRRHYCNTVAFTLSHGHIHALSAVKGLSFMKQFTLNYICSNDRPIINRNCIASIKIPATEPPDPAFADTHERETIRLPILSEVLQATNDSQPGKLHSKSTHGFDFWQYNLYVFCSTWGSTPARSHTNVHNAVKISDRRRYWISIFARTR